MKRRSFPALFAVLAIIPAVAVHASSPLAERVADILDAFKRQPRYVAAVVYQRGEFPSSEFVGSRVTPQSARLDAPEIQSYGPAADTPYTRLRELDSRTKFDCIILYDSTLSWEQIALVEQYARKAHKVVISRSPDTGAAPFVIQPPDEQILYRAAALQSAGLRPPEWLRVRTPIEKLRSFQPYANCILRQPDVSITKAGSPPEDLQVAKPEIICYRSAEEFVKGSDVSYWRRGLRDLSIAFAWDPNEHGAKQVFRHGCWGRTGYHPHLALADYFSLLENCDAVEREYELANFRSTELQNVLQQCRDRSVRNHSVLRSVPTPRDATAVEGGGESLPPIGPQVDWVRLIAQ